jgi:hypothetical protein
MWNIQDYRHLIPEYLDAFGCKVLRDQFAVGALLAAKAML